ncbi:MAG: DUF2469 family protein [Bifidobacterium adolescentis]
MSAEDLDNYRKTDAELALYKEYRDVIKLFTYVVETERHPFWRIKSISMCVPQADVYFDVRLTDVGVGRLSFQFRQEHCRIVTFKDVNVENCRKPILTFGYLVRSCRSRGCQLCGCWSRSWIA